MNIFARLFFVSCSVTLVSAASVVILDSEQQVAESWSEIGKLFTKVIWPRRTDAATLIKAVLNERVARDHLSTRCADSLWSLADGLNQNKQWAIESEFP